jgi:hypothetical protein
MPTLKAKPKKKPTPPPKKVRPVMTTASAITTTHDKEAAPKETSWNANSKEHEKNRRARGSADKPIDEMTHEEHKAYLIREAEENERVNDEIYKKTVDDYPSTDEVQTPVAGTNDEIREKALAQTIAAVTRKVPAKRIFDRKEREEERVRASERDSKEYDKTNKAK